MQALIWIGAALSVAGLVGIIWCILRVASYRKAALADEALRAAMQKIVLWNMVAFGISALGLMLVVVGILLG